MNEEVSRMQDVRIVQRLCPGMQRDSSSQHLHYMRKNIWRYATQQDRYGTTRGINIR